MDVISYNKLLSAINFASMGRVVTKISSCRVNTTRRRGFKRLGISFGSIFLLFSNKSSRGPTLLVAGGNPRPAALNDNPDGDFFSEVNKIFIISYFLLFSNRPKFA